MTRLFFVLMLVVGATTTWAQTDADQTLVKTIDPKEAEIVEFGFDHAGLVTEPWADQKIRMMIEIHSNMPEAIIEQLIKAGRYTIEPVFDSETLTMTITAPNTEKAVTIKGVDLDEQLYINVNMPSQFVRDGENKIRKDSENIEMLIVQAGGSIKGQEKTIRQIGYDIDVELKIVSSVDADAFNEMVLLAAEAEKVARDAAPAEDLEQPARSGAPNAAKRGVPSLDDLNVEYGDIIMGGKPVGFE